MSVLEWIGDNWELIAAIAGWIVSLLLKLNLGKYAKVLKAIIEAVEESDLPHIKKRIKVKNELQGTNQLLDKEVQKVTKGA